MSELLNSTALLIIDMQNGFCHPQSEMGLAVGVDHQQAILPHLEKALSFAREFSIPVFWSKQVHFPEDKTRKNRFFQRHDQKQKFLPCLKGTFETEFFSDMKELQRAEDYVIEKHRASVFYQTSFEQKLKMLGKNVLIVAGCNTEFCVAHTIRDAYARDFEIIVVRDAVAGIQSKHHEACLELFADYFAQVIGIDELKTLCVGRKN